MPRADRWLLVAAYVILILTLAIATWTSAREVDKLSDRIDHLITQVSDP